MTTVESHNNPSTKNLPPSMNRTQRRRRSENGGNFSSNTNKFNKGPNNTRSLPRKKDLGECKFFNTPQGCHAVGCGFQHLIIPGVSYCSFFNTPEGCRRGNTCGFVHSPDALPRNQQTEPIKSRLASNYNNSRQTRSTPNQHRRDAQPGDEPLNAPRFKSLCHFYNSNAGCRLGNQCGFVHKVITPNVTVCHFYGTEKGCQAAQCGFIHQQQQQ